MRIKGERDEKKGGGKKKVGVEVEDMMKGIY